MFGSPSSPKFVTDVSGGTNHGLFICGKKEDYVLNHTYRPEWREPFVWDQIKILFFFSLSVNIKYLLSDSFSFISQQKFKLKCTLKSGRIDDGLCISFSTFMSSQDRISGCRWHLSGPWLSSRDSLE